MVVVRRAEIPNDFEALAGEGAGNDGLLTEKETQEEAVAVEYGVGHVGGDERSALGSDVVQASHEL